MAGVHSGWVPFAPSFPDPTPASMLSEEGSLAFLPSPPCLLPPPTSPFSDSPCLSVSPGCFIFTWCVSCHREGPGCPSCRPGPLTPLRVQSWLSAALWMHSQDGCREPGSDWVVRRDKDGEENGVYRQALTGTPLPLPSGPVIRFLGCKGGMTTWEAQEFAASSPPHPTYHIEKEKSLELY